MGEKRYSSTISVNSALEGVGGQLHASAALPSGMTQHCLYLDRARVGGSGCGNAVHTGIRSWTVPPIARRCTN